VKGLAVDRDVASVGLVMWSPTFGKDSDELSVWKYELLYKGTLRGEGDIDEASGYTLGSRCKRSPRSMVNVYEWALAKPPRAGLCSEGETGTSVGG
jgi:hypothetical protein